MTVEHVQKVEEYLYCCEYGCGDGGCETCPCCSAGYCIGGADGLPPVDFDGPVTGEDLEYWLELRASYFPDSPALSERT